MVGKAPLVAVVAIVVVVVVVVVVSILDVDDLVLFLAATRIDRVTIRCDLNESLDSARYNVP